MIPKTRIWEPPWKSGWIQNDTQNQPGDKKTLQKNKDGATLESHGTNNLLESISIDFWWKVGRLLIDLRSIFCNLARNGCCFGTPFWDRCLLFVLNLHPTNKVLTKSARICQVLTRSNKINRKNGKHRSASATCRNGLRMARLQNEGVTVSRRMPSSIRSGPEGARGVFNSKVSFPIFYFSHWCIFSH